MLKILIADDHEIIRRGLRHILLDGFSAVHVDEAKDCPSLVDKALTGSWDIIVSDLAMPGGGGLEALKQIRKKLPELPVIILSVYPKDQYAPTVIKNGAACYLNKDTAPEELVNVIQNVLTGKKPEINGSEKSAITTSSSCPEQCSLEFEN